MAPYRKEMHVEVTTYVTSYRGSVTAPLSSALQQGKLIGVGTFSNL
jgi:hypothetical protein